LRRVGCRKKGVTLIELIIVLAILAIVVSLGFSLYFFSNKTFNKGVSRSNVQQSVNLAADAITKEVRYASEISIVTSVPQTVSDDYKYIYINDSNLIEFKDKDGTKVIPSNAIDGTVFSLSFESKGSGKLLGFAITGSGEESFSIESEVFPLNLVSMVNGNPNTAIAYKITEVYAPPQLAAWTPPQFEAGIFSYAGISLSSCTVNGSVVTNSTANDSVQIDWGTWIRDNLSIGPGGDPSKVVKIPKHSTTGNFIGGNITNLSSIKTYTMPVFPEYPALTSKGNFTAGWWPTPPPIDTDGYYDTIDVQSELIINVGSGDRKIRVKNLDISGSGEITIQGTGNLILYIENSLTLSGSATINSTGNPKSNLIYYKGDAAHKTINIVGGVKVRGTIFAEDASVNVNNGGSVSGNIITNGANISVNGGSANTVLSIFAPNASVNMGGGASIEGSIIARSFIMSGGSNVTFNSNIFFPDPLTR